MTSWQSFLEAEKEKSYFPKLMQKVDTAYQETTVYPPREEMFSCFLHCPYDSVKVVILGQDPYHGKGQAHGMAFSVKPDQKVPPSLKNIYKELESDLGIAPPNHGYLLSWAKQGVLLMNTSWSVEEGKAGSHKSYGWKTFTTNVLALLNDYPQPLVFILWGNHAIDAAKGITNPKHHLLKGVHPSPLSAKGGFFGSKPFSEANRLLKADGISPVDWSIPNIEQ